MPVELNKISRISLIAVFCCCIFLVFAPLLNSFFDPQEFLTFLNPLSEKMSFGRYMLNGWSWYNDQGDFIGFFRPLASVTYMIEFPVFGTNPMGYKFVNLMMHLFCALITARFVLILSHRKWLALFTGALLVFHPGTVVATGMISARPDIMATIFLILGLTSTYKLSRVVDFTWKATIPAGLMLLSLASKELGMIGIVILPMMYFAWPDRCKCRKNTLVFIGTLLIVAFSYFLVRKVIFGDIGGYGGYTALGDVPLHIATVIAQGTGAFYLQMSPVRVLIYLSVLFTILNYARRNLRKWQKVVVALLVTGACGFQSIIGDTATHYAYIPAAVTVLFLGCFAGHLPMQTLKGKRISALIAILILLAAGAVTRVEGQKFSAIYLDCQRVMNSLEEISDLLPDEIGSVCYVQTSLNSPIEAEMKNVPKYIRIIDVNSKCEYILLRDQNEIEREDIPILSWEADRIVIR